MISTTQRKGILLDTTRCIGCGACSLACKERNRLPRTSQDVLSDTLSDKTFSVVNRKGPRYVRRMCMHCDVPSCASACPVGAFQKTAAGPVVYDRDKCMGCRYCMLACPFNVPKYEWSKTLPRVRKCDMCADRVAQGLATACASVCPTGATKFGTREELLAEARARIAADPKKYYNYIYGAQEVGGTSVLVISDVRPEELGYRTDLVHEPPAMLTWRVLSKIPNVVAVGSVLLGGIYWVTRRSEEVARAEKSGREGPEDGSGGGGSH
ncbi:MAG TPA: 4Fe-4S dicluster domain-containing protein [Thermoanaerobaculia bacterium]|nr:4Fe-4S dicluster domain-containing protein [Thermoanaerobaculia bacterium]